jgi:high-affinity nickel-transport protein
MVLTEILGDRPGPLRRRIFALYILLIGANGLAWLWALAAFRTHPLLLGSGLLAYSLGLRHAVDADHIAAIDNVTRKMMQQGKRPLAAGLFFALGHSSVVVALSVVLALSAATLQARFGWLREIGGLIGTGVSVAFLFAIALANAFALASVYRSFRDLRRGRSAAAVDLGRLPAGQGLLARLCQGLFRLVEREWHMFLLGLVFGLGFDTATEVGLLGLSAASAAKGLSLWSILIFPALFAVGMTLADTTDSILMVGAYGWAFVKPMRKAYYNLTITAISVIVACLIGGIEALGLAADRFQLHGVFWELAAGLAGNLATIGCLMIGLFAACWLVSIAIYRLNRYDDVTFPT